MLLNDWGVAHKTPGHLPSGRGRVARVVALAHAAAVAISIERPDRDG